MLAPRVPGSPQYDGRKILIVNEKLSQDEFPAAYARELDAYLATLASEAALSPNTIAAYRRDLTKAACFFADRGHADWSKLMPEDVADLLADARRSGHAPASIARQLAALRAFLRHLLGENRLKSDPSRNTPPPRQWNRVPEVLPVESVRALLKAPPADSWRGVRDRALLGFLYGAGARVSEACALKLDDLSLQMGGKGPGLVRLTGKGQKERWVPLGGRTRKLVETYLDEQRPSLVRNRPREQVVFVSRSGRPLDRVRVFRIVREWASAAGLSADIHPHILRHSYATHMLVGGADLRSLQELLGHADLATTEIYTRVDTRRTRAAHEKFHPRG